MLYSLMMPYTPIRQRNLTWNERKKTADSLALREGILSLTRQRIAYQKNGRTVATILLSEPKMVVMATQPEGWGYYQFPSMGQAEDGTIIVSWSMKADSYTAYGEASTRKAGPMMSKDKGATWGILDKTYDAPRGGYRVELQNGDRLQVYNPKSKDVGQYKIFPAPVAKRENYTFYPVSQLPEDLKGVYLTHYIKETGKTENIHASLEDPGLLRYAIEGSMPVIWWGDLKELSDGTLIAGVYPAYYSDGNGGVSSGAVAFYQSADGGRSWTIQGKIPYQLDLKADPTAKTDGLEGFTEPSFEVLEDGSFVCIMRTGSNNPMYIAFSQDRGRTWSRPRPFTPNGVKPHLMTLENGVIVLVSGRPGLQIRFNLDGTGRSWTDPIDMVPYLNVDGSLTQQYVSCGYGAMVPAGHDSFYLVYSDFTEKNKEGEQRKAIKFRKITVNKR